MDGDRREWHLPLLSGQRSDRHIVPASFLANTGIIVGTGYRYGYFGNGWIDDSDHLQSRHQST